MSGWNVEENSECNMSGWKVGGRNSGCVMSGWNGGGVIPDAICRGRMLAAESSECEMSG